MVGCTWELSNLNVFESRDAIFDVRSFALHSWDRVERTLPPSLVYTALGGSDLFFSSLFGCCFTCLRNLFGRVSGSALFSHRRSRFPRQPCPTSMVPLGFDLELEGADFELG